MTLQPSDRLLQCWGKTSSDSPEIFHPALYHMLDVGNVARVFLSEDVSRRWKQILARAFHSEEKSLAGWLPWAVAMHDIGKLSSTFQAQSEAQANRLKLLGFSLFSIPEINHPIIGQAFVRYECQTHLNTVLLAILPEVIGGHHGHFSQSGAAKETKQRLRRDEPEGWTNLRLEGASILKNSLFSNSSGLDEDAINISTAIMALTGFTILCDWIGSNSQFFPPNSQMPFESYGKLSSDLAQKAVHDAGFMQPSLSTTPTGFSELFTSISNPRPLQSAVDRIPDEILTQPCLIVIEAPTGEGKTETALAIAHRIASLRGSDEFYYALPTTATSNQMYTRVQSYLYDQLNLKTKSRLVHSQSYLLQDSLFIQSMVNGEKDSEVGDSVEWFTSKKRALLAPFGVGTVDQAELGALNVAHNALRLVGLAGKVLILDEVHAYDTYMSAILARLMQWLSALGTSVILLSATLPRSRRELLAKAFGATLPARPDQLESYPLIYAGNSDTAYEDTPQAAQPNLEIAISSLHLDGDQPEEKAKWLLNQIGEQGCLCWITNTVQRAQDIFKVLNGIAPADVLRILIHSRFPVTVREQIEKQLKDCFGPQGNRPKKAIVIGTQVLEQSLDLDFDGMVSDLAPVDLLLQRAGRLHRHLWRLARDRGDHREPHFFIYEHQTQDGKLNLWADKAIYAEYFLQKTVQVLAGRDRFRLPADYRSLISAVYDAPAPDPTDTLFPTWKKLKESEAVDKQEAQLRLLTEPDAQTAFCVGLVGLSFKEDEDKAGWVVARTRLGEESITIIPMERKEDLAIVPGMEQPILLNQPAAFETQLALMRNSIKISGDALCFAVRNAANPRPAVFEKSSLLHNTYPLWMKEFQTELPLKGKIIQMELDPLLGLMITR